MTSCSTGRGGRTRLAAILAACVVSWLATDVAVVPLAAVPQTARAAASGGLEVLEIRPDFFLIAGAGGSIGVQVGEDGAVVVDAGSAASAASVVDAIKRITPKPIRYVIDTGPDADHVGGNEVLSKAGEADIRSGRRNPMAAPILSAEGVLRHMSSASGSTPAYPVSAWPTETFHYARKDMYWNGEAIEVLHQPAAHTDSDVFVFFRRSDVVVAGDVLDTRQFPVIDVERGGSIQGEIAALNRLVDLAVPSVPIVAREAGTVVIPGHGRLCDQDRRDRVPGHGDDHPRSRARARCGGPIARGGQSREPREGLYGSLREHRRLVDNGPVRRGGVPQPREGGEAVRRRVAAALVLCGLAVPALPRRSGRVEPRPRRGRANRDGVCPRLGADRSDGLLGVLRHRELALSDGDATQR